MVIPAESDIGPLIDDLRNHASAFTETVGGLDPD
jgi:hypothetical protein